MRGRGIENPVRLSRAAASTAFALALPFAGCILPGAVPSAPCQKVAEAAETTPVISAARYLCTEAEYGSALRRAARLEAKVAGKGDYAKVEYWYRWLGAHVEKSKWHPSSAYSALVAGKASPRSMALALQMLCDEAGIPCRVALAQDDLLGRSLGGHFWNVVKVGGHWYHVDAYRAAGVRDGSAALWLMRSDSHVRRAWHRGWTVSETLAGCWAGAMASTRCPSDHPETTRELERFAALERAARRFNCSVGQYESAARKARKIVSGTSGLGARERAWRLHDWLAGRVIYNGAAGKSRVSNGVAGSAYGALVKKRANCEGFARAYELLCETAKVPVAALRGKGHMWNAVKLKGAWYHVDASWDGKYQRMGGGKVGMVRRRPSHTWFLRSDRFAKRHMNHGGWTARVGGKVKKIRCPRDWCG